MSTSTLRHDANCDQKKKKYTYILRIVFQHIVQKLSNRKIIYFDLF